MVPFDFDGDRFLFLDYTTKDERRISVFFTSSQKEEYHYCIKQDFGHISHMKLLPNNKIFLCRKNKDARTFFSIFAIAKHFSLFLSPHLKISNHQ